MVASSVFAGNKVASHPVIKVALRRRRWWGVVLTGVLVIAKVLSLISLLEVVGSRVLVEAWWRWSFRKHVVVPSCPAEAGTVHSWPEVALVLVAKVSRCLVVLVAKVSGWLIILVAKVSGRWIILVSKVTSPLIVLVAKVSRSLVVLVAKVSRSLIIEVCLILISERISRVLVVEVTLVTEVSTGILTAKVAIPRILISSIAS